MRRRPARGWGIALCAVTGCSVLGPADPRPPYDPDRRDYLAFRARSGIDLLEPNYLPFMLHRVVAARGDGEDLITCRWAEERMPLRIYVAPPVITDELQDEFDPKEPAIYVAAVVEALQRWERDLEGLVRFRLIEDPEQADLELLLLGEEAPAPEPDLQVLGLTPVARACEVQGFDDEAERYRVSFGVPQVKVYIADRFGLLVADQVQWIALHEIGHALGMRQHSPIPADLMYEVVRERARVPDLSTEDVNSFLMLYQLPNGTVFTRIPGAPRPPLQPPGGTPRLAMAPYVDPRLGFAVRPPAEWIRVRTDQGMVAVDGATWDYTASFQLIVQRYPTIEEYLERYGPYYLSDGMLLRNEFIDVAGHRALAIWIEDPVGRRVEHLTFIETGDGRLVIAIADCPSEMADAYAPWFEATLHSLDIWSWPQGKIDVRRPAEDEYNAPREEELR